MAAAQLAWGEAQPGKAPAGSRGPSGVWGSPGLPHSILPHLPCTCLAPHGSNQLPPHLLAQPVNAACARRPLLLPGPVLCAPCFVHGLPRARPASARESTAALKAWLGQHLRHPYPSKGEKVTLALISNMSLTQVSTWFANARRRLRKEKRSWAPRSDATEGRAGSLGTGCSPQESSPGPRLEPAPRRPSPQPHTAVLAQTKPPRIWCLAEIATAPRPETSLRRGAARPCWGHGVPEWAARAVYVLPPRLGLGLPWGTTSCPAPHCAAWHGPQPLCPEQGGTEESVGLGEALVLGWA